MNLNPYVDEIHRQLAVAAEAAGEEARALAERLVAPLDATIRLALQDALAAAAAEITVELAPGTVELRLRGREPEFVVTPPPALDAGRSDDDPAGYGGVQRRAGSMNVAGGAGPAGMTGLAPGDGDEGGTWRINVRLPLHMKARIEQAAGGAGLSLNSWLQRAAAAALEPTDPGRHGRHPWTGGERFTGWAR